MVDNLESIIVKSWKRQNQDCNYLISNKTKKICRRRRGTYGKTDFFRKKRKYGILLPKLFRPTVRKSCSIDREKLLKFEARCKEFSKILRSLEQFPQTVKGQNYIW